MYLMGTEPGVGDMRLFLLIILIFIAACGAKHENEVKQLDSAAIEDGLSDENIVTFDELILPLFQNKCSVCHNQDSFLMNVLDYDIAVANAEKIVQAVFVNESMPRNGSMLKTERELVAKWLSDGLVKSKKPIEKEPPVEEDPEQEQPPVEQDPEQEEPPIEQGPEQEEPPIEQDPEQEVPPVEEDPGQEVPPVEQDPDQEMPPVKDEVVSFSESVLPLFQNKCSICHNENSGLINILDYDTAFANSDRIFDALITTKRMPLGDSLSEEELQLVVDWFEDGLLQ